MYIEEINTMQPTTGQRQAMLDNVVEYERDQKLSIQEVIKLAKKALETETIKLHPDIVFGIEEILNEITNNNKIPILFSGAGHKSFALKIGNLIFKLGFKRDMYRLPYSNELLKPILRKEIHKKTGEIYQANKNETKIELDKTLDEALKEIKELLNRIDKNELEKIPNLKIQGEVDPDEIMSIELVEEVDVDFSAKLSEDDQAEVKYQVWKALREQGCMWIDDKIVNIGKIKEGKNNFPNLKDIPNCFKQEYAKNSKKSTWLLKLIENIQETGIEEPDDGKKKILKTGDLVIIDTDMMFNEKDFIVLLKNVQKILPSYQFVQDQLKQFLVYEKRYREEKV